MKKIRFAPLIRVSTEKQEKQGESLNIQTDRIKGYVKSLGGTIPKHCWKYTGQEHATPNYERKMFDQLLEDSGKDLFDAVIVYDFSRWSRDNLKSKKGLNILRENDIRFFVGTSEYDLRKSEHKLFIGMSTEMNEFFADIQKVKSIDGKIAKAEGKNYPTCGKLPYGRTFDKKTGEWGVIPEVKERMEWIAEKFIKGESRRELAKEIGMSSYNLWKVLSQRCGGTWKISFKTGKVYKKVELKIPELLPQETIDAIQKRIASNKTYTHGHIKYKYLLKSMIFCGHCGYVLCGYTKPNGKQYYRHSDKEYRRQCKAKKHIPAEDIEKAVNAHLFKMFGDVSNMEEAMTQAIPNREENEKLIARRIVCEKHLKGITKKRERYMDLYADNNITKTEVEKKLSELGERKTLLKSEIKTINTQTSNISNKKQIRDNAKRINGLLKRVFHSPDRLSCMSFDDKKKILQMAFNGKDAEGNRLGVYMKQNSNGILNYTIKGAVKNIEDKLPMSLYKVQDLFGINPIHDGNYDPFTDTIIEEKEDKQDILGTDQHYLCRKHH